MKQLTTMLLCITSAFPQSLAQQPVTQLTAPQLTMAQGRGDGAPGRRPFPGGPPAPGGPRSAPLGFDTSLEYAARAARVASQLQAGSVGVRRTPQGPRLSLSLTFMGRPVATVMLNSDLRFADRQAVPLLPDSPAPPALSSADRQELSRQIRELVASGLATATGPHVRVALLSSGAPVTDLRFDRASGILLAEPPEKKKDDSRPGRK